MDITYLHRFMIFFVPKHMFRVQCPRTHTFQNENIKNILMRNISSTRSVVRQVRTFFVGLGSGPCSTTGRHIGINVTGCSATHVHAKQRPQSVDVLRQASAKSIPLYMKLVSHNSMYQYLLSQCIHQNCDGFPLRLV